MEKLVLLFFIAFLGCVQSATIKRSFQEIREFEAFLNSTMEGTASEPLTPELAELENIEERSGKFQGDILLTEEQKHAMVSEFAGERNGLRAAHRLWPNKIVVYQISREFDSQQVAAIRRGIAELERLRCLTFRVRTNEVAYIDITAANDGCYASVGYTKTRQIVNYKRSAIGTGCFRHGSIIHELLHAVGFEHMQSTYDRDDYVQIFWKNIQPNMAFNFNKYTASQVNNFKEIYDYDSVMHYSEFAFSNKNGERTIKPTRDTHGAKIGQRERLSYRDGCRLKKLYNCLALGCA